MRGNLILGVLLLVFTVGAIACGERSDVASESPATVLVSGQIITVNADASTIEVRGANDDGGVFFISENTNVMKQEKKIRLSDLAPGFQVSVQAERQGDTLVASYVEILDE